MRCPTVTVTPALIHVIVVMIFYKASPLSNMQTLYDVSEEVVLNIENIFIVLC